MRKIDPHYIRTILEVGGVSVTKIAEVWGISQSAASLKLQGKTEIRAEELIALSDFLRRPIDTLLVPASQIYAHRRKPIKRSPGRKPKLED